MAAVALSRYSAEEREVAMVLCQLPWCVSYYNESAMECNYFSQITTTGGDGDYRAPVAPTEPLPGSSSAPNVVPSDSDGDDLESPERQRKYKLSLFERYKKEQRQWALATQEIRVTAGDSRWSSARVSKKADADRRPSTPPPSHNVRRALSTEFNTIRSREDSEDSDTSQEFLRCDEDIETTTVGNIRVSSKLLEELGTLTSNKATRKLLAEVFPRKVLASRSLTGRPSPAFPGRPPKKRLNPAAVNSIIDLVTERFNVSRRLVRMSITTKLADECKMQRNRLSREV